MPRWLEVSGREHVYAGGPHQCTRKELPIESTVRSPVEPIELLAARILRFGKSEESDAGWRQRDLPNFLVLARQRRQSIV
jgi:hypothetical protein